MWSAIYSMLEVREHEHRLAFWDDLKESLPSDMPLETVKQLALCFANILSMEEPLQDVNEKRSLAVGHGYFGRLKPAPPHPTWAIALENYATTDLRRRRPDHAHLETMRIFLPQGAVLILSAWQEDLSAFVTEVEQVSFEIRYEGLCRAASNLTDVTTVQHEFEARGSSTSKPIPLPFCLTIC